MAGEYRDQPLDSRRMEKMVEVKKIQKQRTFEEGRLNELFYGGFGNNAKTEPPSYSGDEQRTFLSLRTGRDFPHWSKMVRKKHRTQVPMKFAVFSVLQVLTLYKYPREKLNSIGRLTIILCRLFYPPVRLQQTAQPEEFCYLAVRVLRPRIYHLALQSGMRTFSIVILEILIDHVSQLPFRCQNQMVKAFGLKRFDE